MRMVTHKSQEDPRIKSQEATAFVTATLPLIHQPNRDKRFIINMDQTPYNIKDTDSRTLDEKGTKTVTAKSVKTSVGRVACSLAVCADGTKLRPFLICKGKPGGSIEREFDNSDPDEPCCVAQENAWTDERAMLLWVDNVLKPCVSNVPKGVVPHLFLDKHTCHCQGSVAKAMEDLGVEWDIIPGGCAGLVQPIDVGIGKPFKNRMRRRGEEWTVDLFDQGVNCDTGVPTKTTRGLIRKWAKESWATIPNDVVYNSWRHKPFSCFPDEDSRPAAYTDDSDEECEHDVGEEEIDVEDTMAV